MKRRQHTSQLPESNRRGSTLIIVIALLGLLSFTGVVFYTFAAQEKASAQYFSEAAKAQFTELDNVFDWGLRQVLVGADENERNSILYSPTDRFSLLRNMFGTDISPHNGQGVPIDYFGAGLARVPVMNVDQNGDGIPDYSGADTDFLSTDPKNLLELVDSQAAWGLNVNQQIANNELSNLFRMRGSQAGSMPAPDVDYTYPGINNIFLAYRGYAIRDNQEVAGNDRNGNGSQDVDADGDGFLDIDGTTRFELVPVTIPSFFLPTLMKSAGTNVLGNFVPMDPNWATANPANTTFAKRSFRPHPAHLVRDQTTGNVTNRYFRTIAESAAAGVTSGPFPFIPTNAGTTNDNPAVFGECGIWTGSWPTVVELDVDNDQFLESDGSTTKEGIWLDLHFPLQEHVDASGTPKTYVVLHSFSIYDLDGLINLNVHGNINNLARTGDIPSLVTAGNFTSRMLSSSHLGLGPHEINPTYALRRDTRPFGGGGVGFDTQIPVTENEEFAAHYGRTPATPVEQANMEWFWLLTGRADFSAGSIEDILPGRWGDIQSLYFALNNGGNVAHYPRPGRSDGQRSTVSAAGGIRYGGDTATTGTKGYDDNQDRYEGEALRSLNRRRAFGHPLDFAGTGRQTSHLTTGFNAITGRATGQAGNALTRLVNANNAPMVWPMYDGYNVVRELYDTAASASGTPLHYTQRYLFGMNQTLDNFGADDLISAPSFDALLEDPLETIFDPDLAVRPADNILGPQDTFELHMTAGDISGAVEPPSQRLSNLSPWALSTASRNREMLTTYSSSFRYTPFRHPFGNDGRPGRRGIDDDGDGTIDEADEVLISLANNSDSNTTNNIDIDTNWRLWEWTADTDGADRDDDGRPDGDGNLEFPPNFGVGDGRAYFPDDPFRPQVRRTIRVEAGDSASLVGQLLLSPNHIVDVDRQWDNNTNASIAPPESSPEFLYYMQRSGLRFRPLTDHPHIEETDVATETDVYGIRLPSQTATTYLIDDATDVRFPPEEPSEREFWARRDRQQLARDIYVLLYTLGGGRMTDPGSPPVVPRDYTAMNDPNLPETSTSPNALYTHAQLRRMAQFAVNMVDAMDTDNVVTKFEYDKNLGDGWNLDDDPYSEDISPATRPASGAPPAQRDPYNDITAGGLNPEDSGVVDPLTGAVTDFDRGVVYGVESQQLAFNEIFAVRSPQLAMDHLATMHDDTGSAHDFLQIEIQNVTPLDVPFGDQSINKDNCIWRIVRFDRDSGAGVTADDPIPAPNDFQRAIVLLKDALQGSNVPAGSMFTVSSGSPDLQSASGPWNASDFYVDFTNASSYMTPGTWERISRDSPASITGPPTPVDPLLTDPVIDLHHDNHLTAGTVVRVLTDDSNPNTDGNIDSTKGAFLDDLKPYAGNKTFQDAAHGNLSDYDTINNPDRAFDLVLQRRANPNMPQLSQTANPWVEVDRTRVEFIDGRFNLQDTTTLASDVVAELENLRSQERSEPLIAQAGLNNEAAPQGDNRFNTIGNTNSVSGPQWTLHQSHFDRDFASASELLNLPLYPPALLTQRLVWTRRNPQDQAHTGTRGTVPVVAEITTSFLSTADSMFLLPDFPDVGADPLEDLARDNRWYRMLQFVEVPSRVHRMLGNYLNQTRLPGKLNLNMIRHREVFAGLIDDPFLMDLAATQDRTPYFPGPPAANPTNDFPDAPFTHPAGLPGTRDRWFDFVTSRDNSIRSYDPAGPPSLPGVMEFWAPGIPGARPFRTLDTDHGLNLQDTILRQLDADVAAGAATNRRLFEVGSVTEHQGSTGSAGEFATANQRQQLLSKLLNNTTTVSNSFVVFASAGAFEAKEDANGLIQVGGPYTGDVFDSDGDPLTIDHKRAVFLIDRTEALEAFDGGSGDFDWKRLVKARLDIK